MFNDGQHWYSVPDGDAVARDIFSRHYSHRKYKDNRNPRLFVGPGEKLVLLTTDCKALFVWRKFISDDGQQGVNCAIFRNESELLSSMLILEAEQIAWSKWPGERFYTYIGGDKVASPNPGWCFKCARWSNVRDEKGKAVYSKGKHLALLEKYPWSLWEI